MIVEVVAVSTPQDHSLWRWRIINYAGKVVEESHDSFATIASAVEHGSTRLGQMDVVDNSVRILPLKRLFRHFPGASSEDRRR
jgi:hypothetical protein